MSGADYVANERITDINGKVVAAPGETCERVDPKSLAWLLEGGHISQKPPEPERRRRSRAAEPVTEGEE